MDRVDEFRSLLSSGVFFSDFNISELSFTQGWLRFRAKPGYTPALLMGTRQHFTTSPYATPGATCTVMLPDTDSTTLLCFSAFRVTLLPGTNMTGIERSFIGFRVSMGRLDFTTLVCDESGSCSEDRAMAGEMKPNETYVLRWCYRRIDSGYEVKAMSFRIDYSGEAPAVVDSVEVTRSYSRFCLRTARSYVAVMPLAHPSPIHVYLPLTHPFFVPGLTYLAVASSDPPIVPPNPAKLIAPGFTELVGTVLNLAPPLIALSALSLALGSVSALYAGARGRKPVAKKAEEAGGGGVEPKQ